MLFVVMTPLDIVAIAGASVASLAICLLAAAWFPRRVIDSQSENVPQEVAFLFRDAALVDGTDSAHQLLDATDPQGDDLTRVVRILAPQYPDLPDAVQRVTDTGRQEIDAKDQCGKVVLAPVGEQLRLTVEDGASEPESAPAGQHVIEALRATATMHRKLINEIGFPMWRQTKSGKITWANTAYQALEASLETDEQSQASNKSEHDTHLFSDQIDLGGDTSRIQRAKLQLPQETEPRWYEFQATHQGDDLLVTAMPVDRVVRAERSLSGFVQTLTQTFAHLNVGLAIFNRARELVIFNPALTELLDLSPEFLVTRPSLTQVFERMREQRMVPEPKDFKAWRQKLTTWENAASDTVLSETWSLVDGRTFRVTGRPHPEGAVAFLFEDISNEITLERRFRSELQMGHAVLNGLTEAIAVFNHSGSLAMSNDAYRSLWYDDADAADLPKSFVDATRAWQIKARPTPVWGDARDFVASIGERSNWTADVLLKDGRALHCRFEVLSGGSTLVGFSETPPVKAAKDSVAERRRLSA